MFISIDLVVFRLGQRSILWKKVSVKRLTLRLILKLNKGLDSRVIYGHIYQFSPDGSENTVEEGEQRI